MIVANLFESTRWYSTPLTSLQVGPHVWQPASPATAIAASRIDRMFMTPPRYAFTRTAGRAGHSARPERSNARRRSGSGGESLDGLQHRGAPLAVNHGA